MLSDGGVLVGRIGTQTPSVLSVSVVILSLVLMALC